MPKKYIKATLVATIHDKPSAQPRVIIVRGRCSQMLRALVGSRTKGITALELNNTWAYRPADYVHTLRHRHGVSILTIRERHEGGWHGRYILQSRIAIQRLESDE